MAVPGLTITGSARSELKVSSSVPLAVRLPSVTVRNTAELPSAVALPEISPVTGSTLKPAGSPVAVSRAAELAPLVMTWKLNGCPVRPVALVLEMMTGPDDGAGGTVSVSVAVVVPSAFEALSPTWNVPVTFEFPMIAESEVSNVSPPGRFVTSRVVAPLASN